MSQPSHLIDGGDRVGLFVGAVARHRGLCLQLCHVDLVFIFPHSHFDAGEIRLDAVPGPKIVRVKFVCIEGIEGEENKEM